MKKKFLAVALAASMVLGSAFGAVAATVSELDINNAFSAHTGDEALTGDFDVTYTFKNASKGTNNFDNFTVEVIGDKFGITARSDAFAVGFNGAETTLGGWGDNPTALTTTWTFSEGFNWDSWKAVMKNADVTVNVKRNDKVLTFTYTMGDYQLVGTTPEVTMPENLNIHITGENVTLTNIKFVDNKAAAIDSPSGNNPEQGDSPSGNNPEQGTTPDPNPTPDTPVTPGTSDDKPASAPSTDGDLEAGEVSADDVAAVEKAAAVEGAEEGVKLDVNAVDAESDDYKAASKYVEETIKAKAWAVLDLKLMKGDEKVQPNGKIKVTLPIFENIKDAKYVAVYRLDSDKFKPLGTVEVKDSKFTFETDHFSTYLFAAADKPAENETVDGTEKPTGDSAPIAPIAGVMAAAILAVGTAVVTSKKKNA